MRQTTMLKPAEVKKDWYVVDASGKTLGRLASQCAAIIRGKHKPSFTPNVDCGDYVIITNASKVVYSGDQENAENIESQQINEKHEIISEQNQNIENEKRREEQLIRIAMIAAGLLMMDPTVTTDLIGIVLMAAVVLWL